MSFINFAEIDNIHGVENMRFFIPMSKLHSFGFVSVRCSSDNQDIVECIVNENRYKVADGYKITLTAIDKRYGSETFYQTDLEGLMNMLPDKFRLSINMYD